jgi:hypothetical protein
MRLATLTAAHQQLEREATRLSGEKGDFVQRAAVYRQIFRAAQGNHAFPLIAAHGALWAGGQFRFGSRLARRLVWQYPWSARLRAERLASLTDFFNALREINRLVCIDTYVKFHFTRRFDGHAELTHFVPPEFLGPLSRLHHACREGRPLTEPERRELFEAHFQHEQETVVGPTLQRAAAALTWPLVKFIALRPRVRFAYLPAGVCLAFHNFADRRDRIKNGLRAFEIASAVGWDHVERSLADYGLLDSAALRDPDRYFAQLLGENRRPRLATAGCA